MNISVLIIFFFFFIFFTKILTVFLIYFIFNVKKKKRIHSTDLYQTLLYGGPGHAESNELNLKLLAPIDDLITSGVHPLSIF